MTIHRHLLGAILLLTVGAIRALGCSCVTIGEVPELTERVKGAMKSSVSVFVGTVTGFEYRKGIPIDEFLASSQFAKPDWETEIALFKVERWWGIPMSSTAYIAMDSVRSPDHKITAGSSCTYSFVEKETYVVFAVGSKEAMRVNVCSTMTTKLQNAGEIVRVLGVGSEPVDNVESKVR